MMKETNAIVNRTGVLTVQFNEDNEKSALKKVKTYVDIILRKKNISDIYNS